MSPADGPADAAVNLARHRFERCFRDHYADVLAFCVRRCPSREVAEDAAADTFAVAWRRRDRIPDPALVWLYAVARRVLANQYRAMRRRNALDGRLAQELDAGRAQGDPGDSLARRDAFLAALASLSGDEREVLRLVAWDGLDGRDAARVLGCSYGAFRVRLHRARRKLEKQLEASGHLPVEAGAAVTTPAKETL
jgi:RNA polymerase sigma-70 factor (ECF subfamily)